MFMGWCFDDLDDEPEWGLKELNEPTVIRDRWLRVIDRQTSLIAKHACGRLQISYEVGDVIQDPTACFQRAADRALRVEGSNQFETWTIIADPKLDIYADTRIFEYFSPLLDSEG